MKGRNTFVVGLRFPDDVYPTLKERADRKGVTIGIYIRDQMLKALRDSVNTTPIKKPHTAQDEIMALPEYIPTITIKGAPVRVFDANHGLWSRFIAP